MARLNILFFAHDLSDAAVKRRVEMLTASEADVRVVGFVRDARHVPNFPSARVLGTTHNARFLHRIGAVVLQILLAPFRRNPQSRVDVIIARNLEMLFLAIVSARLDARNVPIVYECLDIHRLMLGTGSVARVLRRTERFLTRYCAAIITSSPAYVDRYFRETARIDLPVIMIENRVFGLPPTTSAHPPLPGPPWVIAWNGAIRCFKSLAILDELTRRAEGGVRVVIHGRVSYDQISSFDETVASNPWIEFRGAYRYPEDLDAIYSGAHFNWTIDMFWEGQNSTWALANRIYEGGRSGVVPIAQRLVETGRYYERLGIGLLFDDLSPEHILSVLMALNADDYTAMQARAETIPKNVWTMDQDECRKLGNQLKSLRR